MSFAGDWRPYLILQDEDLKALSNLVILINTAELHC